MKTIISFQLNFFYINCSCNSVCRKVNHIPRKLTVQHYGFPQALEEYQLRSLSSIYIPRSSFSIPTLLVHIRVTSYSTHVQQVTLKTVQLIIVSTCN